MRILLVEDEFDMAAALTAALIRHDIVVDHAPTLEIAEEVGLPIIVLSALGSSEHRVAGLDTGADDYLAKPFSTDELLARLRAVMRRPAQIGESSIKVGQLRFNLTARHAEVADEPLDLTRRELLALEILVRRTGRTVARSALEEAVYGYDDEIASNSLDAHISRLRRKLSGAGVEIHAIRGLGYLLRAAT